MNEESEYSKLKKSEPEKDEDEEKEELLKRADKKFPEEEPDDSKEEPDDSKEEPDDSKEPKEEPEDECGEDEDCEKKKKKKKIKESKMHQNMKLMVDMSTEIISEVEINEATNDKTYVIKGTFSSPGKKNRNGRVYSNQIWEDNVVKYQEEIKNNTINTLSELEHPPRSTVNQWEAVAKTRLLEMRNGIVYGEMEILNNNDKKTNQIKALIDAGIKIGVSTRGVGRMKGSIVEEYNLITTDIVSNPSDYGANLQGFNESMILESQDYSIEDGKVICNEQGCVLAEDKVGDKLTKDGIISEAMKTPCKLAADKLIESMNAYSTPQKEVSEAESKAFELFNRSKIVERKEKLNVEDIQDEIQKLKDKIQKALKAGAMYGNVSKLEKDLKDFTTYIKSTGITEDFEVSEAVHKYEDDIITFQEAYGVFTIATSKVDKKASRDLPGIYKQIEELISPVRKTLN